MKSKAKKKRDKRVKIAFSDPEAIPLLQKIIAEKQVEFDRLTLANKKLKEAGVNWLSAELDTKSMAQLQKLNLEAHKLPVLQTRDGWPYIRFPVHLTGNLANQILMIQARIKKLQGHIKDDN